MALYIGLRPGSAVMMRLPNGELVTVRNLGISSRGGIRLGVEAPQEVPVWRTELLPGRKPSEEGPARGEPQG